MKRYFLFFVCLLSTSFSVPLLAIDLNDVVRQVGNDFNFIHKTAGELLKVAPPIVPVLPVGVSVGHSRGYGPVLEPPIILPVAEPTYYEGRRRHRYYRDYRPHPPVVVSVHSYSGSRNRSAYFESRRRFRSAPGYSYSAVYMDISSDYFYEDHYVMAQYMTDSERFSMLLDTIETRSRDNQFFSTVQIRQILDSFVGDYALLFAQYAYKSCRDSENYYRVVDALYYEKDRRALQDYIRKEGSILVDLGPSERGRFLSQRDHRDLGLELLVISDSEFEGIISVLMNSFPRRNPRFEKTQQILQDMTLKRQGLSKEQLTRLVQVQLSDKAKYRIALSGYYLLRYPEDFEFIPTLINSSEYRQRLRLFSDR